MPMVLPCTVLEEVIVAAAAIEDAFVNRTHHSSKELDDPEQEAGYRLLARVALSRLLECSLACRSLHAALWTSPRARARLLRHCAAAPALTSSDHSPAAELLVWADTFADFPTVLGLLVRPGPAEELITETFPAALTPSAHPNATTLLVELLPLARDGMMACMHVLLRAGFPRCRTDDSLLAAAVLSDAPADLVDLMLAPTPSTVAAMDQNANYDPKDSRTTTATALACLCACRAGNFDVLRLLLPRALPIGPESLSDSAINSARTLAPRLLNEAVNSSNLAVFRIVIDAIHACRVSACDFADPTALYPFLALAARIKATDILAFLITRYAASVEPPSPPTPGPSMRMQDPSYPWVAVSEAILRYGIPRSVVNSSWESVKALSCRTKLRANLVARLWHLRRFQLRVSSQAEDAASSWRPQAPGTIDQQQEHRVLLSLLAGLPENASASPGHYLTSLAWCDFSLLLTRASNCMVGDRASALKLLLAAGASPDVPDEDNPLTHIGHPNADGNLNDPTLVAGFLGVGGLAPATPDGLLDSSRLFFTRPAWQRPDPDSGYRRGLHGGTPLYYTLRQGRNPAIAQLLVFAGADTAPETLAPQPSEYAGDDHLRSILYHAVEYGHYLTVRYILSDPAILAACCASPPHPDGNTPLHAAAGLHDSVCNARQRGEIIQGLLAALPELTDARNAKGMTALEVAKAVAAPLPDVVAALSCRE